jgi:hypothetical protein
MTAAVATLRFVLITSFGSAPNSRYGYKTRRGEWAEAAP